MINACDFKVTALLKRSLAVTLGFIFSLYAAITLADSQDETQPAPANQWQIGLGVGGQGIADYRGSDQYHVKVLPVPVILYTGRYLKINRDGARTDLFEGKRLQINVSADIALGGSDDDNRAREGMPELDTALELGPSINWRLSGDSFNDGWSLRLPFRVAATLGGDGFQHRGYAINPRLVWRRPNTFGDWNLGVSLGALWGSDGYHDYYYAVAPEYVTSTRPEYDARAGFAGSYSKLSIKRNWESGWVMGVYWRYDNLSGATFEHSPLVKTRHYGAMGFGIGKVLKRL